MSKPFPRVGIIGAGQFSRMMIAPATALGIDLFLFAQDSNDSGAQIAHHIVGDYTNLSHVLNFAEQCDLITCEDGSVPLSVIKGLEAAGVRVYPSSSALSHLQDKTKISAQLKEIFGVTSALLIEEMSTFDSKIAVMVARSPHGQATSWTPVEIIQDNDIDIMTIAPAQKISLVAAERAQQIALEITKIVGVVGVMAVEMYVKSDDVYVHTLGMSPNNSGNWSIEGAATSQFEQHLRSILDLPLGSPAMNHQFVVTGNVFGLEKTNMYRPYLHLMARNPGLHFHQYKKDVQPGISVGHVTSCGDDLSYLIEEVEHARDYMSGLIDE